MSSEKYERLILLMLNFNTVFTSEFINFTPDLTNDEITPQLSKILNLIHMEGRITPSKLSIMLKIPISNMSRGINSLYCMGYIVKKQDCQDKRSIYLTLSQKGIEHITRVIYESQHAFWERLSVLSDSEIEELISSFTKIQNTFIKMRELNQHK